MTTLSSNIQKKAKCSAIVWSITYLLLFPFLFFLFAPFVTALPSHSYLNKFFTLIDFLPILSLLFSPVLMCYCYSKAYYKIARFGWTIPVFLFALALLLPMILERSST